MRSDKPGSGRKRKATMEELEQLKTDRRALHRHPELELDTAWTADYIETALADLDCEVFRPIPNSVCAYFDAGKDHTLAYRSDMDALPVSEKTNHDFKSEIEGCMHACGHDGHMALLLAFARRLNTFYQDLDANVLLIFQPGEETPGGARLITQTGLFENYHVDRIYGTHLWPMLPAGVIGSRPGPLMAHSSEVNVDFWGRSSHAARYKEGVDAMEIGAQFLLQCYHIEKQLPVDVYRLLRFGMFDAGTVRNVVASHARLEGTLRAFEDEIFWHLRDSVEAAAMNLAQQCGAEVTVEFSSGYPAVMNDEALFEEARVLLPDLRVLREPEMISEDFSWYLQEVPGLFFFLGTGTGIPLHNDHFDFDEAILQKGVDAYEALARNARF